MQTTQIAIVGGGPAGSTCARLLQEHGLQALVIDKKQFPREKTCAGWITPAVVESLELDLQDYQRHGVLQALHGFIVGMIGEKTARVDYGQPVSYGIRRFEFDDYLLKRAKVPVLENTPIKTIERKTNGWLINSNIEAQMLVGAGGHFCPVARAIGANLGQDEPIVAAQEVEFEMTPEQLTECAVDARIPELYFCRDLKGYGWLFRKGNYLNIGLGRQDNHKLSDHVDSFIDDLKMAKRIPQKINKKCSGHAYLLYGNAPRPLIDEQVLLIGDAAGLAYPQSGEGIRPAIDSAILAARTLIAAKGDFSKMRLQEYLTALEQRLGPRENPQHAGESKWIPETVKRKVAAKFLGSNWFARHYVLNRWFFHLEEKALHLQE